MIPLQLTLKNFLSYRDASLDFRGLHVACICGANGAGKSSLLEAMVWALWGESRALTEDDVIHSGAVESLVNFTFQCRQQIYRVLRSRQRGQASTLEFQIQTPSGFRSLTARGVRATQQLILQHLKLDYDTFINSAYLRQGRADEFMLKRPSERKQILADLLKLDQYDLLAELAKEQTRQLKAELAVAERSLETIAQQLQRGETLAAEQQQLEAILQQQQAEAEAAQQQVRWLQSQQQQRQTWEQQLTLQQQQMQHLSQEYQRLQQEQQQTEQQAQQLQTVLQDAEAIQARYLQLQQLQAEEEIQTHRFQSHQVLQSHRQGLVQQQAEQVQQLKDRRRQIEIQLDWLDQQQQEIQQTLAKAADIEAGLGQLRQARERLAELDQIQMQVMPLMQRRQQIQSQLDQAETRLLVRLEELHSLRQQLEAQQQPQLQAEIAAVSAQIDWLEQQRLYQQQVREKGMERRTFMERLQEQQRKYEREMAELDHKLRLLHPESQPWETSAEVSIAEVPIAERVEVSVASAQTASAHITAASPVGTAAYTADLQELNPSPPVNQLSLIQLGTTLRCAEAGADPAWASPAASPPDPSPSYPPCPLCNHPLDEQHWQVVIERHQQDRQEIQQQLWVIREQLTTSDREIRVLRQEYRDLEQELASYGSLLEQRGKLQEQLQTGLQAQQRLQQVIAEQQALDQALRQGDYATEIQAELRLLDQSLAQFNYDDRDHALVRGQVDRWRWAEAKSAELRQAQRKQQQLAEQQPHLATALANLDQQLANLQISPLQQEIDQVDQQLRDLGYDLEHHTALRQALRQAQSWQTHYQTLLQAQHYAPHLQSHLQELADLLNQRQQLQGSLNAQMTTLRQQLDQTPDPSAALQALEQQIQQYRIQLDANLAALGRLQQQQQQLRELAQQQIILSEQLQNQRRQLRIYQELAQAFGKNGIQALMIENVLPQLEAETNHLLGRLSANQLHVQFVTQRASRKATSAASKSAGKSAGKSVNPQPASRLIDTLDILISDAQGTRPYETYSGGEAFRVNFAIRLALARLLAQRSGMALQLLIIDEGFGTQDDAGCDRLIGAINSIASDFACILTVTHIPHLKEAFQTRIEVSKTEQGSQICLSA
ncbi:MAG: AAA family ATPase [Elainella sp.]